MFSSLICVVASPAAAHPWVGRVLINIPATVCGPRKGKGHPQATPALLTGRWLCSHCRCSTGIFQTYTFRENYSTFLLMLALRGIRRKPGAKKGAVGGGWRARRPSGAGPKRMGAAPQIAAGARAGHNLSVRAAGPATSSSPPCALTGYMPHPSFAPNRVVCRDGRYCPGRVLPATPGDTIAARVFMDMVRELRYRERNIVQKL